jgi:hypothetical protein
MTSKDRPKRMAVYGLTAGLIGGSLAGAALGLPGLAGAETAVTSTATGAGGWVHDALSKLVDDGTINQSQADAVANALQQARPAPGPGGPRRGGPLELDVVAKALGVTPAELRTALEGGQSIAAIAGTKGVPVQTVIDAIVAADKARLDTEVAAGRLTQAQADARLAQSAQMAAGIVNGTPPAPGGPRGPGWGGPKPGAPGAPATPSGFVS